MCVRPIKASDARMLVAFSRQLSPQTLYRRYFAAHPPLTRDEAEHFTAVDYGEPMCFVAVVAAQPVGFAS